MKDLITIIVPIYKVEKYLNKCVDSILRQTYHNLEIILVDDGSPDNCGKICDEYAEKDNRIIVIHKKNGGLSDARNTALDIAKGRYVTFIDSDDYISENYIEFLYKLLMESNADISICEFAIINFDGSYANTPYNNGEVLLLNTSESMNALLYNRPFSTSASGKLFKTEYFADIRFPVGKIYEDLGTIYKIFFKADKFVFGKEALYYYIYRQGSISKQKFKPQSLDLVEFAEEMSNEISTVYPELSSMAAYRKFSAYIGILQTIEKIEYKEIYTNLKNKVRKVRGKALKAEGLAFKHKILVLISFFSIDLLCEILKRK